MNAITARSILINAEKCPAKSPFLTQGLESTMISFFFFFRWVWANCVCLFGDQLGGHLINLTLRILRHVMVKVTKYVNGHSITLIKVVMHQID